MYPKISLNIHQSWTLTKLKLKVKRMIFFPRTHGKQHDVREGIRMRNA